jgi:hypothetical protein
MDREIFENQFHKHFVPEAQSFLKERGLSQKAVLLRDNAPSHPTESILTSNDVLIVVKFLPPNVIAVIQPMAQGVIVSMKRCYWADLLRNLADEDNNIMAVWKKITVLDAIYGIPQAMSSVNPIMLVRLWRKLLPDPDNDHLQGFPNKEISKS